MLHKKSEKGQAIIMIVFSIIGLVGLTALTVDGGMAYADRRHAQGAVDSAAWAAGLANARGADLQTAALDIAEQNGYTNDGTTNVVEVQIDNLPDGTGDPCPLGSTPNKLITVTITSHVKTFFAPVIGVTTVTNKVEAVTRACGKYIAPIFGGNAIVSLNSSATNCAFDSGQSSASRWILIGGGISSNGCAHSKIPASVTFQTPGTCVSAVKGASGGFVSGGQVCPGTATTYDAAYVASVMPPDPCTGAISGGKYAGGGIVQVAGQTTFKNGVYCISDMDALTKKDVVLSNATLYVTDTSFSLKFAGSGGFSGTPTATGTYSSLYMVVAPTTPTGADNCDQQMDYRGNGSGTAYGTVLAPTACIDWRGNSNTTIDSQLIGYNVTSNGTGDVTINYDATENRRQPAQPTISLVK